MMIKAKDAECYTGLAMAEKRYIAHANLECDRAARALERIYKETVRAAQEKRIVHTVQAPAHYAFVQDFRERISA